ncbi:MAG: type II secretion system F family protein [Christensenellales bacterium]
MYKASNRAGQTVEGIIEASDRKEVVYTLREKSLYLLDLTEVYPKSSTDISLGSAKIPKRTLAVFCTQFSSILRAGVPLVQALTMLEEQTSNEKLKAILQQVGEDLQRGRSLSEALSMHERALPSLMVKMIEAGELSGTLDLSLERLANHFDREYKLARRVRSAMTYPTIVFSLAILVVIFLLLVIIPSFRTFFDKAGAELPGITVAMLSFSDFVSDQWLMLIGILVLIIASYKIYKSTEQGRLSIDTLKFKLPVLKKTIVQLLTARLSRTLSTLNATGISLTQALRIASKVVGNKLAEYRLNDVEDGIKQGRALNTALSAAGIFPNMLVQMTKIGEEAGTLDEMLERTAEYFEEEAEIAISKMVNIIQPILLILVAGIVLLVILSVLLPMLTMYKSI